MQVEELMRSNPATCRPDDTLSVPAKMMWDNDVGCVPVVDDRGHAIAMITDRDIAMAAYTRGFTLGEIRVSEASSRQIVTCLPSDALAHAEKLMATHQVRRLAVVDDFGKLVGVLSQNDLIREAVGERGHRNNELSLDEVLRTLGAIGSRPHSALAAAS